MRYETMDGMVIEADTLAQVAEALWNSMIMPDDSLDEWMVNSAKRAAMWNGSVIRTASPEAHVEDLISAGFLRRK